LSLQGEHFPLIFFVVMATQVEKTMDHQCLDFTTTGDTELLSHLFRNRQADDEIPEMGISSGFWFSGKA